MSGFALGYLASGTSLGAAAGALAAGPVADWFGRKPMLGFDAGLYAAGALLSAFTPNAPVLLVARTLIGLGIGADSAIATAYISEYAPRGRRGALMGWVVVRFAALCMLAVLFVLRSVPETKDRSVDEIIQQINPGSGAFLGNLPRSLSHLALVNASVPLRPASQ